MCLDYILTVTRSADKILLMQIFLFETFWKIILKSILENWNVFFFTLIPFYCIILYFFLKLYPASFAFFFNITAPKY